MGGLPSGRGHVSVTVTLPRPGGAAGRFPAPGFGSDPSHSSLRRPASVSDARAPSQLSGNLKLRVRPRPEAVRSGPGRSAGMALFPVVVRRGHRFSRPGLGSAVRAIEQLSWHGHSDRRPGPPSNTGESE